MTGKFCHEFLSLGPFLHRWAAEISSGDVRHCQREKIPTRKSQRQYVSTKILCTWKPLKHHGVLHAQERFYLVRKSNKRVDLVVGHDNARRILSSDN